ncbi:hypothetical protein H2200_009798 [Cladophialophora chaetospira]|uniref:Major facilitator superfamily (MFS) profile domain-containing protein n=1 Tax=Cladophialophora chaetospira TaxID=386627 RepID=A0AA38X368_9EURO|nr:hypothetical protein H2200_009798 [Cladophialophora chaetospira]
MENEKALEFVSLDLERASAAPVDKATAGTTPEDSFLVGFTGPTDPDDPKAWPKVMKWSITGVLSATGFVRILVSTIMAPALPTIAAELNMNDIESVMAMSVYLLSTAFGPLVIAPLSEVCGRRPVLHATNMWTLVWNLACGFANDKGFLIAARLMAGFGAGAIYVLAGGVLGDIWRPEQRGTSLGLYAFVPLLGAAVGPIIGGVVAQNTTWRWIFWGTSIVQVVTVIGSIIVFKETYAPVILRGKAQKLRKKTGELRYMSSIEKLNSDRTAMWILRRSLSRPIRLLLFHPIVQIQTCLSAFNYGILYLVLTTYSTIWTAKYQQTADISGLHYIALCLGEIIGAVFGGPLMDLTYRRLRARNQGSTYPEFRAPILLPATALSVIGFLWYGWSAQSRAFWLLVDIGAAVLSIGMQLAGMVVQAYVIDSYHDHVSSASAGAQLVRSLTAFGFPLFAPAMYSAMGYGWANTLLALVSVVISVPAAWLIWFYGAKMRGKVQSSY